MDNIYTYLTDLPPKVHEMVVKCLEGYTVYLDSKDSAEDRVRHYEHAFDHILKRDHESNDVQTIEKESHKEEMQNE